MQIVLPASANVSDAGVSVGNGIDESTTDSKIGMLEESASPMAEDHVGEIPASTRRLEADDGIGTAAATRAVVARVAAIGRAERGGGGGGRSRVGVVRVIRDRSLRIELGAVVVFRSVVESINLFFAFVFLSIISPSFVSSSRSSSFSSSSFYPRMRERRSVGVKRSVRTAKVVLGASVEVAAESAETAFEGPRNVNLEFVVDFAPSDLDADDGADDDVAEALVQDRKHVHFEIREGDLWSVEEEEEEKIV